MSQNEATATPTGGRRRLRTLDIALIGLALWLLADADTQPADRRRWPNGLTHHADEGSRAVVAGYSLSVVATESVKAGTRA